jgi:hypothetical protein
MRVRIYDPIPRNPETNARVHVGYARPVRVVNVVNITKTRNVRVLKSGVRRITF